MKTLVCFTLARGSKLFLAGSLALVLTATSLRAQNSSPAATAASEKDGKKAALSPVEQTYLQGVAKENLGEIAVAYLALEKATSSDVKSHAKDLIDTHTKTMKELMELASKHDAFFNLEPNLSAYQKLQTRGGADFDKFYAAEAQRLNQEAIDKLNPILSQFTSSDVKDFAQGDLKDDKEHLESAQKLAAKLK